MSSHSCSDIEKIIRSRRMPALFTSTSSLPEAVDGLLHHGAGLVEVGDVGAVDHGLAAHRLDLGDHLVGRARVGAGAVGLGAEVVHDHRRALARQHQRVLAADAAARPGHDRHPSVADPHCSPLELVSDSRVTLVSDGVSSRRVQPGTQRGGHADV